MDQGHALLVGVGGSGRQSCARLAAFAAGCEVFEITLSRGYGEEEFREDLKTLYNKLGIENKKVCINHFAYVCYICMYLCTYIDTLCLVCECISVCMFNMYTCLYVDGVPVY